MSNHFSATIPLTETPVNVATRDARDALAYLARRDATDLAEALGLVDYRGVDYDSKNRTRRVAVRKGTAL